MECLDKVLSGMRGQIAGADWEHPTVVLHTMADFVATLSDGLQA